ncbi:MAG: DNA cytosine methyltransferase [Verrucomicrobia bacterium]|nr:DNA cytosine methyltransferase [Verrucomicrobiota bacterium]
MKVVDLFAGGGGLSLGFMNAGFDVVAAFDHWDSAIRFYRENITDHPIFKEDLNDPDCASRIAAFRPDMIVGGPPCQDFSSAGSRDETKGRANLTISFSEIISNLKPAYFVMENVERARKSKAFQVARDNFLASGYQLTAMVLDASLCGVPQKRKRFFVYGELDGEMNSLLPYIMKNQADRPMTLRDYFGDRLDFDHYYRHPRSYKRRGVFSVDEPSPTIRGVNRPVPDGYPGHAGDTTPVTNGVRPLTTKERSLVQTFPESFELVGTKTDLEQIVGNAVPVKLAEFVARAIRELHWDRKQGVYPKNANLDAQQLILFEQRQAYALQCS